MEVIGNWGGNRDYRAGTIERPATLGELQRLVAAAPKLSVVGTRHSFGPIGDGDRLVDLSLLVAPPVVDSERRTMSVSGAATYADVARELDRHALALHNLASLPHISVAGAIATGTHGSGSALGSLATAIESIELITADGDPVTLRRGDDDFVGAVVHLGALGVITRVELRVEDAYDVSQTVFDGLTWDAMSTRFDDVFASATSVSVFTRWGSTPGELWCKQRVGDPRSGEITDSLTAADSQRHPIPGMEPSACTTQRSIPGPWWDRWPHFRADAVPSAGAEIQSEFFVDRADSAAAVDALREIGPRVEDVLLVSEIRTVAADELWMSPCHGRDSTAFHFTWRLDPVAVTAAVAAVGGALAPLHARPHWGKVVPDGWTAAGAYERLHDFLDLRDRLDPRRCFTTPWIDGVLR